MTQHKYSFTSVVVTVLCSSYPQSDIALIYSCHCSSPFLFTHAHCTYVNCARFVNADISVQVTKNVCHSVYMKIQTASSIIALCDWMFLTLQAVKEWWSLSKEVKQGYKDRIDLLQVPPPINSQLRPDLYLGSVSEKFRDDLERYLKANPAKLPDEARDETLPSLER